MQLEAAACASRLPHSLLAALSTSTRGLLVAGELRAPEDRAAALAVSRALRWPLLADVLSGLRVGATAAPEGLIACGDNILAAQDPGTCTALRPDVVLQLGGRLTSKRMSAFLAASSGRGSSAGNDGAAWWVVDASPHSFDEHGCLAGRVRLPLGALERLLREAGVLVEGAAAAPPTSPYVELWRTMDREVGFLVRQRLNSAPYGEAHIAACLASCLPRGGRWWGKSRGGVGRRNGLGAADQGQFPFPTYCQGRCKRRRTRSPTPITPPRPRVIHWEQHAHP